MRAVLLAGALLAAAPAAARAEAAAPGVYGSFQTLCVATGGDRAAALAAADRDGWSPVPDALLSSFAGQFKNASGRLKSSSSGIAFLILGEQEQVEGGQTLHMKACGVGGSASDPAAVASAVQAYAAVPPSDRSTAERSIWAYTEEAGRHAPLSFTDKPALKAALAKGNARVLFEQGGPSPSPAMNGQMVVVVLAVPTS